MKHLGTINDNNSIATKQYVEQHSFSGGGTAPSFEVMIIDHKLVVRNIDPSLNGLQPVIFRRVKTSFLLEGHEKRTRKKGWIAPHYSKVAIGDDGVVSFTPQEVTTGECSAVEISSSPVRWTREKDDCFCWGTCKISKFMPPAYEKRRKVIMHYGIAFCKPTADGYGQKAYNAVTEIVPFKVANCAAENLMWETTFIK